LQRRTFLAHFLGRTLASLPSLVDILQTLMLYFVYNAPFWEQAIKMFE